MAKRGGAAGRGGTSRAGAGGVTGAGAGFSGTSLPCSSKLGPLGAGAGSVLLQHRSPPKCKHNRYKSPNQLTVACSAGGTDVCRSYLGLSL